MRFINFIKNLFYNSHLDFLKEKDIIWAKRYNSLLEKEKIMEGHREGPYIIISKRGKRVYGLECSSSKSSKSIGLLKLKFNRKDNYNLSKDGYIYVGRLVLLNSDRFIRKLGFIDDEDINRIYKSIYLINQRYKSIQIKNISKRKISKFYYDIGDIILYKEQMYYIYKKDKNYYYVLHVNETKKRKIIINDISYAINFANEKKISKKENFKLLNISDKDMINNIEKYLVKQRNTVIDKNYFGRGTLILYNNYYYYIYGEYQNNLLTYKVYLDHDANKEMYKISIKNGIYYTLLEEYEINKSEKMKNIRIAKLLEMDMISNLKKEYLKKKKVNKSGVVSLAYKKFIPGYIIIQSDTLDRYIIITRKENVITYAPIDNIDNFKEIDLLKTSLFNYEVLNKMDKYKFQIILKRFNEIN